MSRVAIRLTMTLVGFLLVCPGAHAADDKPVLPAEVTIRETPAGQVFADTSGKTLYTYEADEFASDNQPACVAECARAWPPLVAPPNATGAGDWTPVKRADGLLQWTVAGKPVYTFATETGPSQILGARVAGWRLVKYVAPPPKLVTPGGVGMREIGSSYVLTDAQGHTLYARDGRCADACEHRWRPLLAPALAHGVGDWTLVARSDGLKQWAFAKSPVYTFAGDNQPGEVNGRNVEGSRTLRP